MCASTIPTAVGIVGRKSVGKGAGGHYPCHRKESDQSFLKWKIINFTNSNAANKSSYI